MSRAPAERAKADTALAILDGDDVALSVQVLQEFYVQATRPSRADKLTHAQASQRALPRPRAGGSRPPRPG